MNEWLKVFKNTEKVLFYKSKASYISLHIEWTKINEKSQKWSTFRKPEAFSQTVLPDKSILNW